MTLPATPAGGVDDAPALVAELRECIDASQMRLTEVAFKAGISENGIRAILDGGTKSPSGMTLLRLMREVPGFAERLGFRPVAHAA